MSATRRPETSRNGVATTWPFFKTWICPVWFTINIRPLPSLAETKSTGELSPVATGCSSIRTGPLPISGRSGVGVGVAVGVAVAVAVAVAVGVAVAVAVAVAVGVGLGVGLTGAVTCTSALMRNPWKVQ